MPSTPEKDLSEVILAVTLSWIASGRVPDAAGINMGPCREFALDVIEEMQDRYGRDVPVFGIGTGDLKDQGRLPMQWDRNHVWIEAFGKCFDAEAPDGVDEPFDLPFFDPETMCVLALMEEGRMDDDMEEVFDSSL